jgi:phosphoenolpyruvate---glycerone phosphotransferase subunit DhaK
MKKFINDPMNVVDEALEGFLTVHGHLVRRSEKHPRVFLRRQRPKPGKVALVTGGGSGHKPAFIGYVGEGMLDAITAGDVFSAPPVPPILESMREAENGGGVLLLIGNYSGDVMNFEMAGELALDEGMQVAQAIATDDVGAGFRDEPWKRRGVSGEVLIWKCCGAAAEMGAPLAEVQRVAEKVNANTRTMGVATAPCTVPAVGKPTFTLAEDEMEVGVGHHGEAGLTREPMRPADEVVDMLTERIVADLPYHAGDRVVTLINGLGATPLMELYIAQRRLAQNFEKLGIQLAHSYVGEYFTAMEMAGFSITLLRADDELFKLVTAPAHAPHFVQG